MHTLLADHPLVAHKLTMLRDASTGQAILIDAANEAGRLIELIGDTPVGTIVTTHRHADHWQALAEVQAATGAAVAAHSIDAEEIPVTVTERTMNTRSPRST